MAKANTGTLENAVGQPKADPKPRNYKLALPQLTEQVIALETKEIQAIQTLISQELLLRKTNLEKQLAELNGH